MQQQPTNTTEIPELVMPDFSTIAEECHFNWFTIDHQINGKTKHIDAQKLINDLKLLQLIRKNYRFHMKHFF